LPADDVHATGVGVSSAGGYGPTFSPAHARFAGRIAKAAHPVTAIPTALLAQAPSRTGCVSFSGTSRAFISAWLMMPSDSATWAIVPPVANAVLAMSAAFS
jgi:hypothetical protein